VALADFRERGRRFAFVALIAAALFAAFWFVPRESDSLQIMTIQPDRFAQAGNPTWIPMASAWGLGFFLPLIGFFYLRNALAFDETSGVSQCIASSPVGNVRYMLGKLCSGTLLLYCPAAVVVLGSFFMMLWHFPGQILTAREFLTPFAYLLTALPFCAALALLFESVRVLRGAIGSVLFVAAFVGVYALLSQVEDPGLLLRSVDFSGTSSIVHAMGRAVLEQSGRPMDTLMFLGGAEIAVRPTQQLVFSGVPLTADALWGYAGMAALTLGLTLLSAPLYALSQRLSAARIPKRRRRAQPETADRREEAPAYRPQPSSGRPLWASQIAAELRLMLAGQPLLWKLVCLAGFALCLFLELGMVQRYVLPLLLFWFVNGFSSLGSREHRQDMLKLIAVVPGGRFRQVLSSWLAGVLAAFALSLPAVLRTVLGGQPWALAAAAAGVLFLPSLALFLGEFTKTRRAFELLFVLLTYLGLNGMTPALYMGLHPEALSPLRALGYLAVGACLAAAAIVKRTRAL
jgi:hypothetical protein